MLILSKIMKVIQWICAVAVFIAPSIILNTSNAQSITRQVHPPLSSPVFTPPATNLPQTPAQTGTDRKQITSPQSSALRPATPQAASAFKAAPDTPAMRSMLNWAQQQRGTFSNGSTPSCN